MIDKHFVGEVTMKIDGFDTSLLNEKLYRACKVISLYTEFDSLYLTTIGVHEKRVRELCEKSNCVCETIEHTGAIYSAKRYIKRYGMFAGAVAAAILIFFLSNIVMKIEIKGTSDEVLIAEVRALLKEEGLSAGTYIPSLNFFQLSNRLFMLSDRISWASIGSSGSVIYVNISETTPRTDSENMRIPCNIIASRDAVIVDAKVMVGQLNVLLGDAVYKGQMLVSGVIEHRNGVTKYFHSYARITGRYEETISIKQKYIEETILSVKTAYRKSLNFFELEIPLPGNILGQGKSYSERSLTTPVKLFGFTLPISVTTYEYTEQTKDIKTYSTAEALKALYSKLENYETDMLNDVEIIERRVTESQTDDGVMLTVEYVLEGEIGQTSDIYIK